MLLTSSTMRNLGGFLLRARPHCSSRNTLFMVLTLTIIAATSGAAEWTPTNIGVMESIDGEPGSAKTRVETNENNDARITVDLLDRGSRNKGTMLLISGRWMASHGLTLEPGAEIDIMDVAALNSQLAIALLKAALPEGPPISGVRRHVLVSEENKPIDVATTSASGEYGAPWTVEGNVWSAKGTTSYDLTFSFTNEKQRIIAHLKGDVSTPIPPLIIPDSTSLDDWLIHKIGPYQERATTGTTLDYGARPADRSMTVGELRKRK